MGRKRKERREYIREENVGKMEERREEWKGKEMKRQEKNGEDRIRWGVEKFED